MGFYKLKIVIEISDEADTSVITLLIDSRERQLNRIVQGHLQGRY